MTPEKISFTIKSMREADLDAVVTIHRQSFPDSRSTKLGKPFLRKMYHWFVTFQPELAFVACIDGRPSGFVTGAIGGSSRKIFRYALWEILGGFLRHPVLLLQPEMFDYWYSYLSSFAPKYKKTNPQALDKQTFVKATLDSIAVSPRARGKDIGKSLVRAFENAAQQKGATIVALGVERDNITARRLYESRGWKLMKENEKVNSAKYSKSIR